MNKLPNILLLSSVKQLFLPFVVIVTVAITFCSCTTVAVKNNVSSYKPIIETLFTHGNWSEAIRLINVQLDQEGLKSPDILYLRTLRGNSYRFSENYISAESDFNYVVNHKDVANHPELRSAAYYGLGDLYYLKWNYFKEENTLARSRAFLDSSLVNITEQENAGLLSKTLYRLGTIMQIQGDLENGMKQFERGLALALTAQDTAGIIRNDTHKASILERAGEIDSALYHYTRSYQLAKQENRNYSEAHGLCNLGQFHFEQDNKSLAKTYYDKAELIAEELNHGIVLGRSYYNLSTYYLDSGSMELAKEYCEKGLQVVREKGYKNFESAFEELAKKIESN